MNGKPQHGAFQGSSADTDAAGRFSAARPERNFATSHSPP